MRVDDFHRIVIRNDPVTGLRAIFAIHDLTLGPALGGVRRWAYPDHAAALADVTRLARGMTCKNALADLPFGGGKSLIVAPGAEGGKAGPPARPITEAELAQFGRWIEELGGDYVAAEDVGMRVADLACMGRVTRYVTGIGRGGRGGNPGPRTAEGVVIGIEVAAARLGLDLAQARIAVQGLGNVGMAVCERLHGVGATLIVADIDAAKVALARRRFGAKAAAVDEVLRAPVDIVAPCALGGAVTDRLAATMPARAIAGSANNQLANLAVGETLRTRGILYAPDYVINAGGVISAGLEYLGKGGYDDKLRGIGKRLERIFDVARESGATEADVAEAMAREALRNAATTDREAA